MARTDAMQAERRQMYPPEVRQTIIDRIANGESLRAICESEGMPGKSTVMEWLEADADFRTKYARAREAQADVMFDGMADIESDVLSGVLKPDAAKVVLWSRQWRAEKLKPKVYGAKLDLNHAGEIGIRRIERVIRHPAD